MAGFGERSSSFYNLPWGRIILFSMLHFRGEKGVEDRRAGERDSAFEMLLRPSSLFQFKILSTPKHQKLEYHFQIPHPVPFQKMGGDIIQLRREH